MEGTKEEKGWGAGVKEKKQSSVYPTGKGHALMNIVKNIQKMTPSCNKSRKWQAGS